MPHEQPPQDVDEPESISGSESTGDIAPDAATLTQLTAKVLAFREERDWAQFHNPKDVALSLSLEAAELLEWMQWRQGSELDRHLAANRESVGEELADVLYWVLLLASDLHIDLETAFLAKLRKNAVKYPMEAAKGRHTKYNELASEAKE